MFHLDEERSSLLWNIWRFTDMVLYWKDKAIIGDCTTDKFIHHIKDSWDFYFLRTKVMETRTFTFIIYALYTIYLHYWWDTF
jgi:hypothetical protein